MNQNQQRNQQPQQEAPKKDKIELAFRNPVEFNGQSGIKVTTTLKLCRYVNDLFRTFKDYEGCIIDVNKYNGQLMCSLYFHVSPQLDEYSIVQSAEQMRSQTNSIMEKYNRMSAMSQNKKLFLTKLGKSILFDFIIKNPNQKDPDKFNWNQLTVEKYDQQQYGQGVALLEVNGIDLNKLIPKFYTNPDKRFYQWNLNILRPVGAVNNMGTMNHLVQITRLDCTEVENLAKELGFFTPSGSIPIVR